MRLYCLLYCPPSLQLGSVMALFVSFYSSFASPYISLTQAVRIYNHYTDTLESLSKICLGPISSVKLLKYIVVAIVFFCSISFATLQPKVQKRK